ncbi:hypothetical protein FOA52_000844 [Chlamydomonas sp. UWO 241]|nr:hypothetical protein FOA52_000844 [Chlamydomonas sp. UWO 241]
MGERPDRPIFVGNYEYDAEEKEITRLFERYGRVTRIDMKTVCRSRPTWRRTTAPRTTTPLIPSVHHITSPPLIIIIIVIGSLAPGFAFVYMEDKRDGDDAIRALHTAEFGYKRRKLICEWAKQAEADRKKESKPNATIFCVNFDVQRVTERDLGNHFDYYGRIKRIEIKKNFAFIQYDDIKDAIRALESENGKQFKGRTITVEYVQNENPWGDRDGDRRGGGGGGRSRSRSPRRRTRSPVYDRRRSPSPAPARRRSPSPAPARRRSPSPARRRSPSPRRSYSRSRSPRR